MKTLPRVAVVSVSCVVALLSLLTPSCGGSATQTGKGSTGGTSAGGQSGTTTGGSPAMGGAGGGAGMATTDTCVTADDCAWGEINTEIIKSTDCMCLFGCPYLPQTKTTANRRQQQYSTLCTPDKDGMGQPCPVDDCALPGALACVAGACQAAASADAGGAP